MTKIGENENGPRGAGNTIGGLTHSLDYTEEGLAMKATARYIPFEPKTWVEPLPSKPGQHAHLRAVDTRPWTGGPEAPGSLPPSDGGWHFYYGLCGSRLGRTFGPSHAPKDRDTTTGADPVATRCPKCLKALDRIDENEPPAWSKRTRGASSPSADVLAQFADVYKSASSNASGTARLLGWDRGTVYRWIKWCREREMLPPTFDGDHRPRRVRWSHGTGENESWMVCAVCRTPWPCAVIEGEQIYGTVHGFNEPGPGAETQLTQDLAKAKAYGKANIEAWTNLMRADPVSDLRKRLTITVPEAGAALGLGRDAAYAAAERGEIPAIKVGRRLVVPTHKLLAMLGID